MLFQPPKGQHSKTNQDVIELCQQICRQVPTMWSLHALVALGWASALIVNDFNKPEIQNQLFAGLPQRDTLLSQLATVNDICCSDLGAVKKIHDYLAQMFNALNLNNDQQQQLRTSFSLSG